MSQRSDLTAVEPAEEEVLRLRERVAALEAERDALEARVEAVGVTLATDAQEVITARTRERDELARLARPDLALAVHVKHCPQCGGPNDGCELGQRLEQKAHEGGWR
jgi:hypothetical protein